MAPALTHAKLIARMSKVDLLEYLRTALKESVAYFSSANQGALDQWVVEQFLTNLGLEFGANEVIRQREDPPDVIFRRAAFEVKEILDPGRRRHDEYSAAPAKALTTSDPADLAEDVDLEDITPVEIGIVVAELAQILCCKYEPRFRPTLDLLAYVNPQSRFFREGTMPDLSTVRKDSGDQLRRNW